MAATSARLLGLATRSERPSRASASATKASQASSVFSSRKSQRSRPTANVYRGRDELINDCTRPAPSRRLGIAVAAQELRQLAKKLERTVFVGEHQLCHHAVIITAVEMRLQPGLVALLKGEVRFGRIDDFRAGVHIGFGGIGLDQLLREAVNGSAGELIDGVARALHLRLLLGGDPGAERQAPARLALRRARAPRRSA